jgi:S-DNA-T family DNA segregation ATPase FtsK/SpoIIIE
MASSGSKTRNGSSADPLIPTRRKIEVLGLTLMVMALLFALAFATYTASDNAIASDVNLWTALAQPSDVPELSQVHNALGILGAELARVLIPHFLGFTILVPTLLLFAWGFAFFRRRDAYGLLYPSVLTLVFTFILAAFIGWWSHTLDAGLRAWAGHLGLGVAGWMQRVAGSPGSFIVLLLLLTVVALLAVDHDIQRSLDRLAEGIRTIRARLSDFADRWQERHQAWREKRAQRRAERREAREARSSASEASDAAETSSRASSSSPAAASSTTAASTSEGATSPSAASADASPPPPSEVADVEAPDEDWGVRRNDLFRPGGSRPRSSRTSSETDASQKEPSSKSSAPSSSSPDSSGSPEPEPSASSPSKPDSSSAADADAPAENRAAEEEHAEDAQDVEMTVQEQVEEEKAEDIDNLAGHPRDFEYEAPPIHLLEDSAHDDPSVDHEELEENKQILLDKLDTYNVDIQEINAVVGPTVTRYELTPAPGIKVSRIKSLEDDLAMAMAAQGIRMIAPIPGKSAVGVEIPNRNRELVRLRDIIGTKKFRDAEMELPIPLGKTIEGEVFLADLTDMPHLLIAGATGSGKSVGLNAIITGLLYSNHPADLNFVIIDPKKIELQQFKSLAQHFVAKPEDLDDAVITEVDEALGVLKSCEKEMSKRYDLLSDARVRDIRAYNRKFDEGALDPSEGHQHMPYIVVVVDELADLMMTAGKEIEGPISRLAQMARAVGIHLVLATQRPSVDVITGLIKANFPSRIAFEVASRVDSRTILDQIGAEGLVGNGDLLFQSGSKMVRLQGPFISVEEVERIVTFIADQEPPGPYELPSLEEAGHGPDSTLGVEDTDELFEDAARVIVRRQQGSVSLLQRKLAVGYTRAARIVDQLEEANIVGPFNGTKARDVLVEDEEELDRLLSGEEPDEVSVEDDAAGDEDG